MKLRVKVDQKAAFSRGYNAPTSIVDIEVDPSTLTPEERVIIASRMGDDGITLRLTNEHGRLYNNLVVARPDLAGIQEAIAANEVYNAELRREKEAAKEKNRLAALEVLAKRKTRVDISHWDFNGNITYSREVPAFAYEAPSEVTQSPEAQAWLAELNDKNDASLEQAKKKNAAETDAIRAKHQEKLRVAEDVLADAGSKEQRERRKRGYMTDEELLEFTTRTLTDEFFFGCPLKARLTFPPESEIDMESYKSYESYESCDEELPKVLTESTKAEAITNELMQRILMAETHLAPWIADKNISAEPWKKGITRDHEHIPWSWNFGLKLSSIYRGFDVEVKIAI